MKHDERLTRLEAETVPAVSDVMAKVSVWSKILPVKPEQWATPDVVDLAVAAVDECERRPAPAYRTLREFILDRLPLLRDRTEPEHSDPHARAEVVWFGSSPEVAAALVASVTGTLTVDPPSKRFIDPEAKRRLYDRLGLDYPEEHHS